MYIYVHICIYTYIYVHTYIYRCMDMGATPWNEAMTGFMQAVTQGSTCDVGGVTRHAYRGGGYSTATPPTHTTGQQLIHPHLHSEPESLLTRGGEGGGAGTSQVLLQGATRQNTLSHAKVAAVTPAQFRSGALVDNQPKLNHTHYMNPSPLYER